MTRHSHCSSCASTDSGSSASSPGSSSSASSGSSKSRNTKTPKKQQQVKKADGTPVKRQVKKKLENRIYDEEAVKLEQAQSGQELDSSETNHDTQSDAGTVDVVVRKVDDVEHEVESVPNDKPVDSEVVPEVEESVGVEDGDAHDVEHPAINVDNLLHEGDGGESSCDENDDVNVKLEQMEAVQELEGTESKLMHHEADSEDVVNEVPNDEEGEVVNTVDTEVGPLEKETVEGTDSGVDVIAAGPEEEAANVAEENGESSSDEKEEDIVFLFNKSAGDDGGVKEAREEQKDHKKEAENIPQVNGIEGISISLAEKQQLQGNSEQVKPEEATETPVEVEDTLDSQVKAEEVVGNGYEISENEDKKEEESLMQVEEEKPYGVVKSEETPLIDDNEGEKKSIEDFRLSPVDQSGQEEKVGESAPVREDAPAREKIQSLKIDLPSSDSDTDREHNEHAPKVSTPSPPKRDREGSSVYKIVKALEGLQVGEKCVHGEIDHGLCHERKVRASSPAGHVYTMKVPRTPEEYRRLASSPADYSGHSRTRDSVGSGTKPYKEPVEHRDVGKLSEFSPFQKKVATPEPTDTVESRDGGRKEVNSEKTFVQYDSQTGSSTGYTASSTVETYSDTVIFKREDGFVAGKDSRTPVLKEIFENGVESGSAHPNKLRIVHEFPAEKGEGFGHRHDGDDEEHTLAAAEFAGESEVERILRLQETHDIICPNCRSCITKRVILRKRKRTATVVVNADRWEVPEEEAEDIVEDNFLVDNNVEDIAVVEEYEDWGCSACFTWLFRRVRGTRSTQPVEEVPEVPEIGESIVIPSPIVVSEVVQPTEQPSASEVLELPTTPRSQRSDNSCLPILFIWRRKKTIYPESGLATPLLGNKEEEQPEPEATQSPEIHEQVVHVDENQLKELPAENNDERELSPDKIQSAEIQADSVSVDTTTDSSELPGERTQVSETLVSADTSESTEPAAELTQISEIQEHTETLPSVKEVRVPVAVIESSEDRLCFPFIWRRREKKTIQLPSSDLQEPLLVKTEEEEEKSENHDYSQIPEELWFHGEEVAISVAPEDHSAEIPPPPPSVTVDIPDVVTVTRSERQADCNCLPGLSWRSPERVQHQTDGAAQSEISATPVSLEFEEAVLPEASSTSENDRQKASVNCMDILLPAYPWGPKGGATIPDVAQVPKAPGLLKIKVPEVNLEKSSSTVEWSSVTQYLGEGTMKVESRAFNIADMSTVDRQPQHEDDSAGEGMDLEPVNVAQEVEAREASKCLPLVLPSLSWRRRQDRKTGEVWQEEKSSAGGPELVGERKKERISEEEKEGAADVEVSRSVNGDLKPNHQIDLEDEVEDEPLVRRSPVKVQPIMMDEGKNLPSISLATQDSSVSENLTPTYDSFFWDSLPEEPIPGLRPAIKEIEEEGPFQISKPVVISADVLEDIIPGYGGLQYKESKEMGSWDCCLPFYTQRHIHIIGERPLDKPVAPEVTDITAEEKGRVVTEEVSKETTVDARVTTTTTTIQSSHDPTHPEEEERVDAIKVDTSVSYVHTSVQEDQDADIDRNEISNAAAQSVLSEHGAHDDEKSLGVVTEVLDEMGQKDTDRTMDQETGPEEVSEARESAIDVLQPVPAEETQQEAGSSRCCLPLTAGFPKWQWGRRAVSAEDSQLREPLLPKGDDVVHVTVQQSHTVTETTETPRLTADPVMDVQGLMVVDDDTACSFCLPWSRPQLLDLPTDMSTDETETTVTVTTDDTVLEVEGRDAEETLLAAREAAEDAGMVMHETSAPEYLKSIVYGGLDVSLTSLGVVASAAGGDAKTRNVIAFGLANLVFGFIAFYHKIQDLHNESPSRFRESVGPSFWVNGFLAIVSFLIFGALPPLMFGFTFRESNDHDYKMGATVIASVIAITLLGCGKVASKMTELSYKRTISTLILTGVAAAVAGFYTGEYISKLLDKYGIFSD